MAHTYPSTSASRDSARLRAGDVTLGRFAPGEFVLSDEEWDALLSGVPDVEGLARGLEAMAARYAGQPSMIVDGDQTVTYGNVSEKLMEMAARYRAQLVTGSLGLGRTASRHGSMRRPDLTNYRL